MLPFSPTVASLVALIALGSLAPSAAHADASAASCAAPFKTTGRSIEGAARHNPLLAPLAGDGVPFETIDPARHVWPAMQQALKEAQRRLETVRRNGEAPTFDNTIAALDWVSEPLTRPYLYLENLNDAEGTPTVKRLTEELSPKVAAFHTSVYLDKLLFERVKTLHDARASLGLDAEQATLLEGTYREFVRNGALLDPAAKGELIAIDKRIAELAPKFSKNVVAATNAFELWVTDPADLAGLPESAVKAAAGAAKAKGREGAWLFGLGQSSYMGFLTYSDRRELREQLWRAYRNRAAGGAQDNRPILLEIAQLRLKRARLLGYKTHADFTMEDRMARNPDTVRKFLGRFAEVYRPAAMAELAQLTELAGHEIQPWDELYYSEKLRQKTLAFSEEDLKPYFEFNNVMAGTLETLGRVYGIRFAARPDLKGYHPDVRAYEVTDARDGRRIGIIYTDFFERKATKTPGAWAHNFRPQGIQEGALRRPIATVVGSFEVPTDGSPTLLTFRNVETIFHEMGHALHTLLSDVRYASHSGTSVPWDFVELPSQKNENWASVPGVLDRIGRHYQTGEPIPMELIRKVQAAGRFQRGLFGLRQLSYAFLDLAWHADERVAALTVDDVLRYDLEALAEYSPYGLGVGNQSPSFTHLFSGGYGGGYYSYKWAEGIAADAWEAYERELPELLAADSWDQFVKLTQTPPAVALRFRENILSRGGSEPVDELYRRFRGADPDPDALLRKEGLLPAASAPATPQP